MNFLKAVYLVLSSSRSIQPMSVGTRCFIYADDLAVVAQDDEFSDVNCSG